MYFNATVRRVATVQFLPQNAPETAWRQSSAWTRWGNLQTYIALRFSCQDLGRGLVMCRYEKKGKGIRGEERGEIKK